MRSFLILIFIIFSNAVYAAEAVEGNSTDQNLKKAHEYIQKRDYEKAVPLLKAIVTSHKSAEALTDLGYSYRQLGLFNKALKTYQESLEIDPNYKKAHEYLGEVYLINEQFPKAQEHLQTLEKICSSDCAEYKALKEKIDYFKKTIYRVNK